MRADAERADQMTLFETMKWSVLERATEKSTTDTQNTPKGFYSYPDGTAQGQSVHKDSLEELEFTGITEIFSSFALFFFQYN